MEWLRNSDEDRVLTFSRRLGSDELIVALNMSNRAFVGTVEVSGTFEDITPTVGSARAARTVGLPAMSMDAWGFRILRRTR